MCRETDTVFSKDHDRVCSRVIILIQKVLTVKEYRRYTRRRRNTSTLKQANHVSDTAPFCKTCTKTRSIPTPPTAHSLSTIKTQQLFALPYCRSRDSCVGLSSLSAPLQQLTSAVSVENFPWNDDVVVVDNETPGDDFSLQSEQNVLKFGAGIVIMQTSWVSAWSSGEDMRCVTFAGVKD